MDARTHLQAGISQLALTLSESQIENLLGYVHMIQEWNRAYNLVGTSSTEILINKHILDSLAILPFVTQGPVLDVGSGAGLPGIPLAIALPDISFTLLDANGKKTRFMRHVIMQLKMSNIDIVQNRIEHYQAEPAPNIVLSRAFAPVDKALQLMSDVCAPKGTLQIMLGMPPARLEDHEQGHQTKLFSISVPYLNSQRHLLVARRDSC